jgi:acyl-CoA thioesterase FadM
MNLSSLSVYCYPCFIPFHLADPAGILFFGHVFTLAHEAFEHFVIDAIQSPWTDWFQNSEWIVPIKHAEANYMRPLQAGDECQIELVVTDLSASSFTMNAAFIQQHLCCEVKTVHVFCSRAQKQKIPIPSFLFARFKSFMPN